MTNTNEPTGRELAEAAARAMGWDFAPVARMWVDSEGVGRFYEDEELEITEREMLAHLHKTGIVHTASSSKVCEVRYMSFRKMQFVPSGADETVPEWVTGTDLREALARLVVAVAEREKQA